MCVWLTWLLLKCGSMQVNGGMCRSVALRNNEWIMDPVCVMDDWEKGCESDWPFMNHLGIKKINTKYQVLSTKSIDW